MTTQQQIASYLSSLPEAKRRDIEALDQCIRQIDPGARLWFNDGRNAEGKVVSNPSIGYGEYTIRYANQTTKEFFRVGVSGNKSGISVYVMGLEDPTFLPATYGKSIGKATVTGYCIKFKSLSDVDLNVLTEILAHRLKH